MAQITLTENELREFLEYKESKRTDRRELNELKNEMEEISFAIVNAIEPEPDGPGTADIANERKMIEAYDHAKRFLERLYR